MKEAFEKIKERLEKKAVNAAHDYNYRGAEAYTKAIEIVNQVAEEYGGCELHNAKNIYDYIQIQINPYGKLFKGTVYEFGLKVMDYIKDLTKNNQSLINNGWIPVSSGNLPKEGQVVNATILIECQQRRFVTQVMYGSWWLNCDKRMIAWKPLKEPYEGE